VGACRLSAISSDLDDEICGSEGEAYGLDEKWLRKCGDGGVNAMRKLLKSCSSPFLSYKAG
jgi:hypothetical protein